MWGNYNSCELYCTEGYNYYYLNSNFRIRSPLLSVQHNLLKHHILKTHYFLVILPCLPTLNLADVADYIFTPLPKVHLLLFIDFRSANTLDTCQEPFLMLPRNIERKHKRCNCFF